MAKDKKYIRKRKRKYGDAFLVDIPYVDENGVSKHFTETVRVIDYETEKAALLSAQKIRNDALQEIQTGRLKKAFPTLKMLYQKKWSLLPLSVNTREKHDAIYKATIAKIENTRIDKLTISDIQLSLNEYAETHSDDAVKRLLTIYKQLYKTAHLLGYDVTDHTAAVVRPVSKVVTKKKPVEVSEETFRTVLDGLLTYNGYESYNRRCIWFMLQIMYYTGMRPSEVLALTADDITDSYISVTKRVGSTTKNKQMVVPPKTASSVRKVPIPPQLTKILEELLLWSKHDYLFACEDGTLWNIDTVSDTIHRVAKKHKVNFNAYMLRHKMSSDLLHQGDPVIARDLLGHTSFSMTLDYARSTDEQIRNALIHRSAENQPKNNNHIQPPATTKKIYSICRFCAVLRFSAYLKRCQQLQ